MKGSVPSVFTLPEMGEAVELQGLKFLNITGFVWSFVVCTSLVPSVLTLPEMGKAFELQGLKFLNITGFV